MGRVRLREAGHASRRSRSTGSTTPARGECRVPASWRVLYKDGDDWKPVEAAGAYGVAKDRYNQRRFKPVTTSALRLEVTLQPEWSAGIQEWKVE